VAELPHPTALTNFEMKAPGTASQKVAEAVQMLQPYAKAGWNIEADPGMENEFAANRNYKYGRTDIGPAYYDFGTPKNRMVSVSSASRMSGKSNVVVIGTRDKVVFNTALIDAATAAKLPEGIPAAEMFTARPRLRETRSLFDRGPGEAMAKIMKENLNMALIGKPKSGMDPKTVGIAAFNIKTHPKDVADFGHYRGTFKNARVLILADPDGVDDILTSRALTGTRGQYLHGLMEDMKIQDQYLVIKTVPFGMDGATNEEWKTVLQQTAEYRKNVLKAVMEQNRLELVIADGPYAGEEIASLLGASNVPLVRVSKTGLDNNSGLKEAAAEISKIELFKEMKFRDVMANLPRTHLGFMARVWEGTSGTRVFDAISPLDKGVGFAIVAPEWAYKQKPVQDAFEKASIERLKESRDQKKIILPGELYLDFIKRIQINDVRDFNPRIPELQFAA